VEYRYVFLIVGTIELTASLICFIAKTPLLQVGILAWLASCFLLYRIFLICVGYVKPCSCLGSMTTTIHISPETANNIMKIIMLYLMIGSYTAVYFLLKQSKR
jgi:hypothetical protein